MNKKVFYPDVAGYYLIDAINVLKEHNIEISDIKVTAPPKHVCKSYDDTYRVIKVCAIDKNKVGLLICNPMINY